MSRDASPIIENSNPTCWATAANKVSNFGTLAGVIDEVANALA